MSSFHGKDLILAGVNIWVRNDIVSTNSNLAFYYYDTSNVVKHVDNKDNYASEEKYTASKIKKTIKISRVFNVEEINT
jgi:hypothetical protein